MTSPQPDHRDFETDPIWIETHVGPVRIVCIGLLADIDGLDWPVVAVAMNAARDDVYFRLTQSEESA